MEEFNSWLGTTKEEYRKQGDTFEKNIQNGEKKDKRMENIKMQGNQQDIQPLCNMFSWKKGEGEFTGVVIIITTSWVRKNKTEQSKLLLLTQK